MKKVKGMRNKIVTLICLITILTTTILVAADDREPMQFSSESADQIIIKQLLNDTEFPAAAQNSDILVPMVGNSNNKAEWQNVLPKKVTVKYEEAGTDSEGTGLHVRTTFAFEAGDITDTATLDKTMYLLFNNEMYKQEGVSKYFWTVPEYNEWIRIEINGEPFYMVSADYTKMLTKGQRSEPSLMMVGMESNVSSEEAAQFGATYEMYVYTQASSDAGALTTFNKDNHPWITTSAGEGEGNNTSTTLVENNNQ